jgi:DHA1 family multidrug resistance protein-like MFS transporter
VKLSSLSPYQRTLWAVVISEVLAIMAFQAGFAFIPYYIQEMGVTDMREVAAWTGAFQSAGSICFAIFTPIWGALGDRYGRKMMLMRAMVATAVVFGLMGFVRTPMQLLLLRIVQGCTTGTPAAASALIAASSPRDRLAYGLGLVQTSLFIGMSLGPMMGGYIAEGYGYRVTFFISAAIVVVATLLVLFFVSDPSDSATVIARARRENAFKSFVSLFGSPRLMLLVGMTFMLNMTYGLLGPVLPILVQQLVSNPEKLASTAGTITGVAAFTAALSALVVGRLSDMWGHRRMLLLCAAGTGLCYVPLAFARSVLALGVLRSVQGLFQGGIAPNVSAMTVSDAPKEKVGAVLGLNTSAGSVGFAVGPLLGALLLAVTTSRAVFLVAAGSFGLITLAVAIAESRAAKRLHAE